MIADPLRRIQGICASTYLPTATASAYTSGSTPDAHAELPQRSRPARAGCQRGEKHETRRLRQVDERRNHRTRATVNQLLDGYLKFVELEHSTRTTHLG
jgi:hypothetical protein